MLSGNAGETVGIVIVDVTRYERKLAEADAEVKHLQYEAREQEQRAEELSARVKAMLNANDELTALNAELRTYNEQLLINAEESASSNEEVETLNEEMQATNEELETLNEELQATVEELNTTNDELEARSRELEQANATKQAEVERAEAQRTATALALGTLAPLCVVLNEQGELFYAGPALRELTETDRKAPWLKDAVVSLGDGTKYKPKRHRLEGGLTLVTFDPVK